MGPRQCRKSVSSCSCARRACVPACAPASRTCARGGIMQDATGSMQLATDNIRHATADTQHTACNLQHATSGRPHVWKATLDPCRAVRSALQLDGCGAAITCNSHATGFRQRATHNTSAHTHPQSLKVSCDTAPRCIRIEHMHTAFASQRQTGIARTMDARTCGCAVAEMWADCEPSPCEDLCSAGAQSRCRCGQWLSPVPVQMWAAAEPSPGADVGSG